MAAVYWIGADGNIWLKDADGTRNVGSATDPKQNYDVSNSGFESNTLQQSIQATRIDDPNPPQVSGDSIGSSAPSAADLQAAQDAKERAALKAQIMGHAGEVDSVYGGLFADLDKLLKARGVDLERQYGDQFKATSDQYADAIPQIETSYAAIGAGDSTDNTYAKVGAKKGFDSTTKTIGDNKKADEAKLGQYGNEQKAKFAADQNSAKRNLARVDETTDVDALRGMRNDLESNLDTAGVTRASLGTDQGARGELSRITANNGRYEAAVGALDTILKSSLSGGVKQAAVQAVTDNAGLSDEEKKKVQETYGNVYAEQSAL